MPTDGKAMVQQFVEEFWNRGNVGVVDQLFSADWIWRSGNPPGMPSNREGLKMMASMRAAFTDATTSIHDQIAEGKKVVTRWSFEGTNSGSFMGLPPTGKRVTFWGVSVDRVEDGKFVERWDVADMGSLMQQLSPRA